MKAITKLVLISVILVVLSSFISAFSMNDADLELYITCDGYFTDNSTNGASAINYTGDYGTGLFGQSCEFNGSSHGHFPDNAVYSNSEWCYLSWVNWSDSPDNNAYTPMKALGGSDVFALHTSPMGINVDEVGDGQESYAWNPDPLINNAWIHLGVCFKSNLYTFYVNGTYYDSNAETENGMASNNNIWNFGGGGQWVSRFWGGSIDDVVYVTRNLTIDEIYDIYNNSITSVPVANPDLDILLWDKNNNTILYPDEDDIGWPVLNWTLEGVTLNDGECSFNLTNARAYFSREQTANYTLSAQGQILNLTLTESQSADYDTYSFEACRSTLIPQLEVLINDVSVQNLTTEIPNCNIGTHKELMNITAFTGSSGINLTLRCANCDNINEQYTIVSNSDDSVLTYQRYIPLYKEDMTQKGSIYIYDDHYLGTYSNFTINASCNDTSVSESFTITDNNLTIDVLSINNLSFTPGMEVEIQYNNTIRIDVFGDIITDIAFNLTNSSGALLKASTEETLLFSSLEDTGDGIYNISISATDDEQITTLYKSYFILNDTTSGSFTWGYPSILNTSTANLNQTKASNITFQDENLFAVECLVYNPGNKLYYNFTSTGLTGTSKTITDSVTYNETGNWSYICTGSDWHTQYEIDDIPYKIKDKSLNFSVMRLDGLYPRYFDVIVEYKGLYTLERVKAYKQTDRYKWEYDVYLGDDKFNSYVDQRFFLKCDNSYWIRQEKRFPSFVCWDSKNWVDFNTKGIQDFDVYSCGVDCWDVRLRLKPNEKIKFDSIGGLNQVTESASVAVAAATADVISHDDVLKYTNTCPTDSLQDTIIFIFMFIIGAFMLVVIKFWVRIPGLTMVFALFVSIFFGLALMNCSAVLGSILMIFGLMFAIAEFMS